MKSKSLSDIVHGNERDSLARAWDETEAATSFDPLPTGTYEARVVSGELINSKSGTPGFEMKFRVLEGEFKDRLFWTTLWLTPAALPMAKRDLAKLGVTALEQLERPIPPGIRVRLKVALRKDDNGAEYNRVKAFEVLGVDSIEDEAFPPHEVDDQGDEPNVAEDDEPEPPDQDSSAALPDQVDLIPSEAKREAFRDEG